MIICFWIISWRFFVFFQTYKNFFFDFFFKKNELLFFIPLAFYVGYVIEKFWNNLHMIF